MGADIRTDDTDAVRIQYGFLRISADADFFKSAFLNRPKVVRKQYGESMEIRA